MNMNCNFAGISIQARSEIVACNQSNQGEAERKYQINV